jgi:hypothetical protein
MHNSFFFSLNFSTSGRTQSNVSIVDFPGIKLNINNKYLWFIHR